MKRKVLDMYKKKCKECGTEIMVYNVKTEICWRCIEKLRKELKKGK